MLKHVARKRVAHADHEAIANPVLALDTEQFRAAQPGIEAGAVKLHFQLVKSGIPGILRVHHYPSTLLSAALNPVSSESKSDSVVKTGFPGAIPLGSVGFVPPQGAWRTDEGGGGSG